MSARTSPIRPLAYIANIQWSVRDHGRGAQAQAAIAALDGQNVDGRTLRVSMAEARESGGGKGHDRY